MRYSATNIEMETTTVVLLLLYQCIDDYSKQSVRYVNDE
jgi:hypothetical protein